MSAIFCVKVSVPKKRNSSTLFSLLLDRNRHDSSFHPVFVWIFSNKCVFQTLLDGSVLRFRGLPFHLFEVLYQHYTPLNLMDGSYHFLSNRLFHSLLYKWFAFAIFLQVSA